MILLKHIGKFFCNSHGQHYRHSGSDSYYLNMFYCSYLFNYTSKTSSSSVNGSPPVITTSLTVFVFLMYSMHLSICASDILLSVIPTALLLVQCLQYILH